MNDKSPMPFIINKSAIRSKLANEIRSFSASLNYLVENAI